MRRRSIADGADRPVGRDPLPGSMRQHGGQIDRAGGLVDGGGLHGGDLMLAKVLRTMSSPLDSEA